MSSVELRRRANITRRAREERRPGETVADAMERLTREPGVVLPDVIDPVNDYWTPDKRAEQSIRQKNIQNRPDIKARKSAANKKRWANLEHAAFVIHKMRVAAAARTGKSPTHPPTPGEILQARALRKMKRAAARLQSAHDELRRTRPERNAEAKRRVAEHERNLQIEKLERAIAKTAAVKQRLAA